VKNPILTFSLCILFGFMALRLIVGGPDGPLRITPAGGLGEAQVEFMHDRFVEVATGKRDSGKISDLTNFEWDTVCLFLPGWVPPGGPTAPYPLYDASFSGDDDVFHMVFGKGGIRNMTARFKRTDQLDFDPSGESRTGCLPAGTSFSISQANKDAPRYLVLK